MKIETRVLKLATYFIAHMLQFRPKGSASRLQLRTALLWGNGEAPPAPHRCRNTGQFLQYCVYSYHLSQTCILSLAYPSTIKRLLREMHPLLIYKLRFLFGLHATANGAF